MGRLKEKLTDYKNFWLIWISAAGQENGISLFRIQSNWDIKTNYLYHDETGLGKPLFRLMEEQRYIDIVGKKIKARFDWVPEHVNSIFRKEKPVGGFWSPELVLKEKWQFVQPFMQAYRKYFFELANLRILYRADRDTLGTYGRYIFLHVFIYVLFSNIIAFSKKYNADVVSKMAATLLSLGSGADLLNYMYELHSTIGGSPDFPLLFRDESELSKILCNLKW
jgi:hypothetical protein